MIKLNSVLIGAIILLGMAVINTVQAATIYTFIPTSGGSSGTIEFASPPSTSSGAWSTGGSPADDIIALESILNVTGPSVGLGGALVFSVNDSSSFVESYNGTELDAGRLGVTAPLVIGSPLWYFAFSDQPGGDEIRYTGFYGDTVNTFGDWTVSVVPVPAAVWLFGSGLLALVGITRRKSNKLGSNKLGSE